MPNGMAVFSSSMEAEYPSQACVCVTVEQRNQPLQQRQTSSTYLSQHEKPCLHNEKTNRDRPRPDADGPPVVRPHKFNYAAGGKIKTSETSLSSRDARTRLQCERRLLRCLSVRITMNLAAPPKMISSVSAFRLTWTRFALGLFST